MLHRLGKEACRRMTYALDTSVLVRILSGQPQPLAADVIRAVYERISLSDFIFQDVEVVL